MAHNISSVSAAALDMPRRFNEYQHSKKGRDIHSSNISSNRGEKGREEIRREYDAHEIGRKEILQASPFSSIDAGEEEVS